MTYKELAEISARYAVAHREMLSVLNDAITLANVNKASKHNEEIQEIMQAYSQTRLRLIDSILWFRYLHSTLVPRTDEARKAAKDYQEKLEEAEKKAKESGEAQPAVEAAPAEPAQEDGKPCLKLL